MTTPAPERTADAALDSPRSNAAARAVAVMLALMPGCFADSPSVEGDGTGASSGSTTIEALTTAGASSTTAPALTTGAATAAGDDAPGTSTTSSAASSTSGGSSDDEAGSTTGHGSGSSTGTGSSTGEPVDTVYADCFDDEGAQLCAGSCLLDTSGEYSACAPDCSAECPEGGGCLDELVDEVAALVCVLPCADDDECPGNVCAPTSYTAGGLPFKACLWP